MGFIAPMWEPGQRFDVLRMDVQFWALTGWFGLTNEYLVDVGLLLVAMDELQEFRIAVPFSVRQSQVKDLRSEIESKASVIIGPGTTLGSDAHQISFSKPVKGTC